MKLIVNTSNIVIGGGIQVSLSLINEFKKHAENEYHIFLSTAVKNQLNFEEFEENFKFYDFPISPSSIKKGFSIRKRLQILENEIHPDLVFTVFGPAYWKPKNRHITGFADGWCYGDTRLAYKNLSWVQKIKTRLVSTFKNHEIKKADYIVVETKDAKENIIKKLKFHESKLFVIGNTCHQSYSDSLSVENVTDPMVFKLLVLSAYYPHKNLEIINDVARHLEKHAKKKYLFQLTIPEEKFQQNFHQSSIINLGLQNIKNCPSLYAKSDALFLPTLLETFTANYPEAMKMNRPILTSDLNFAHSICGNAAIYFDPLNSDDMAEKIIQLSENKDLYKTLVQNGQQKFSEFETSESRANLYLRIFRTILEKKNEL